MFWGAGEQFECLEAGEKFESLGSWRIPLKKFHYGFDVYSCYSYIIL